MAPVKSAPAAMLCLRRTSTTVCMPRAAEDASHRFPVVQNVHVAPGEDQPQRHLAKQPSKSSPSRSALHKDGSSNTALLASVPLTNPSVHSQEAAACHGERQITRAVAESPPDSYGQQQKAGLTDGMSLGSETVSVHLEEPLVPSLVGSSQQRQRSANCLGDALLPQESSAVLQAGGPLHAQPGPVHAQPGPVHAQQGPLQVQQGPLAAQHTAQAAAVHAASDSTTAQPPNAAPSAPLLQQSIAMQYLAAALAAAASAAPPAAATAAAEVATTSTATTALHPTSLAPSSLMPEAESALHVLGLISAENDTLSNVSLAKGLRLIGEGRKCILTGPAFEVLLQHVEPALLDLILCGTSVCSNMRSAQKKQLVQLLGSTGLTVSSTRHLKVSRRLCLPCLTCTKGQARKGKVQLH